MYDFLTGPMFYLALSVFVIGLLVRIVLYIRGLDWKLDRVAYRAFPAAGMKGAARSIFYWLMPFGTRSWRTQPFMMVVFFVFHLGAVLVPLFLLAHNLILKEKLGVAWFVVLPQGMADVLSWGVIITTFLLVLRRFALAEVRILTTAYDYFILVVTALPFITGLAARYAVEDYQMWVTLHVLFGELLMILAPFTKLSHIVLFFMSRAQLGMDYGIKRGGRNPRSKGIAW